MIIIDRRFYANTAAATRAIRRAAAMPLTVDYAAQRTEAAREDGSRVVVLTVPAENDRAAAARAEVTSRANYASMPADVKNAMLAEAVAAADMREAVVGWLVTVTVTTPDELTAAQNERADRAAAQTAAAEHETRRAAVLAMEIDWTRRQLDALTAAPTADNARAVLAGRLAALAKQEKRAARRLESLAALTVPADYVPAPTPTAADRAAEMTARRERGARIVNALAAHRQTAERVMDDGFAAAQYRADRAALGLAALDTAETVAARRAAADERPERAAAVRESTAHAPAVLDAMRVKASQTAADRARADRRAVVVNAWREAVAAGKPAAVVDALKRAADEMREADRAAVTARRASIFIADHVTMPTAQTAAQTAAAEARARQNDEYTAARAAAESRAAAIDDRAPLDVVHAVLFAAAQTAADRRAAADVFAARARAALGLVNFAAVGHRLTVERTEERADWAIIYRAAAPADADRRRRAGRLVNVGIVHDVPAARAYSIADAHKPAEAETCRPYRVCNTAADFLTVGLAAVRTTLKRGAYYGAGAGRAWELYTAACVTSINNGVLCPAGRRADDIAELVGVAVEAAYTAAAEAVRPNGVSCNVWTAILAERVTLAAYRAVNRGLYNLGAVNAADNAAHVEYIDEAAANGYDYIMIDGVARRARDYMPAPDGQTSNAAADRAAAIDADRRELENNITARQRAVLHAIVIRGLSYRQTAAALNVSHVAIVKHIRLIREKAEALGLFAAEREKYAAQTTPAAV